MPQPPLSRYANRPRRPTPVTPKGPWSKGMRKRRRKMKQIRRQAKAKAGFGFGAGILDQLQNQRSPQARKDARRKAKPEGYGGPKQGRAERMRTGITPQGGRGGAVTRYRSPMPMPQQIQNMGARRVNPIMPLPAPPR